MPEIVRPSERPARALLATPITLPMSRMEVAPTWAMISCIFALTSSGGELLGEVFLERGGLGEFVVGEVLTVAGDEPAQPVVNSGSLY